MPRHGQAMEWNVNAPEERGTNVTMVLTNNSSVFFRLLALQSHYQCIFNSSIRYIHVVPSGRSNVAHTSRTTSYSPKQAFFLMEFIIFSKLFPVIWYRVLAICIGSQDHPIWPSARPGLLSIGLFKSHGFLWILNIITWTILYAKGVCSRHIFMSKKINSV